MVRVLFVLDHFPANKYTNRVRILINAAFDTKSNSGISGYIKSFTPYLSRLCKLTILTPDPELFAPYGETVKTPDRVRTPRNGLLWTLFRLPKLNLRRYDLIFTPTPATPIIRKIPAVATVHDLIPFFFPYPRKKILLRLGIQSLRRADGIITVSESTRRDLVKKFPALKSKAVEVIHSGPCVHPGREDRKEKNFELPTISADYLLYVGGHAPHKNLSRLVAAFAKLAPQFLDLQLVLVGWGTTELVSQTRDVVTAYQLQNRVLILPNTLTAQQLSHLYRHCRLFVYPSLYEGFGLPVLEAMAHGAAVACSKNSSLPEVGGDVPLYFNPYSVDEIAQTIYRALTDENLHAQLRSKGISRANLFSWENTAKKMYTFFQMVVQEQSSRLY